MGNYGTFNVLTASLAAFCACKRREPYASSRWSFSAVALLFNALCLVHIGRYIVKGDDGHEWLSAPHWLWQKSHEIMYISPALRFLAQYRIANAYGVFRDHPHGRKGLEIRVRNSTGGLGAEAKRVLSWAQPHQTEAPWALQWFAPLQPRLEHSLFYWGMSLGFDKAVFNNHYFRCEGVLSRYLLHALEASGCGEIFVRHYHVSFSDSGPRSMVLGRLGKRYSAGSVVSLHMDVDQARQRRTIALSNQLRFEGLVNSSRRLATRQAEL